MLAGNRNQALFLAVLPAAADPGVLLFFALGQIPMFLSPSCCAPVYGRAARPVTESPAGDQVSAVASALLGSMSGSRGIARPLPVVLGRQCHRRPRRWAPMVPHTMDIGGTAAGRCPA